MYEETFYGRHTAQHQLQWSHITSMNTDECSRYLQKNVSRLMTKPTKWLCAQWRLRSAWASVSAWRKLRSLATHWAHSEDSDQTGRMPKLIWVFAGRTVILLALSWGGSICVQSTSSTARPSLSINKNSLFSKQSVSYPLLIFPGLR